MRKITLFMLMAVGLLISTQSWAQNVCKMDGTEYATLAAAVAAVPDNNAEEKEIILIADDVEPSQVVIPKGKKIKINLNGHKLTTSAKQNAIDNSGSLTIIGNGVTAGAPGSFAAYNAIRNGYNGKLSLYNGTYIGGHFYEEEYDIDFYQSAITNYFDESGDNTEIFIYGGVYCSYEKSGQNPAINAKDVVTYDHSKAKANVHIQGGVFSHTPSDFDIKDGYAISEVAYNPSDKTFPLGKAYVVHPKTGSSFTDDDDESVALSAGATTIDADQKVAYLEIGSGATLMVNDGKTLTIGDYGLAFKDATSKLIIEPGAIVKVGAAGVLADDYVNIEMHMSDLASSQLIFAPEINLNYQPKATVVYTPNSYMVSEEKKINAHFGVPFAEIAADGLSTNNDDVEVGFAKYVYGDPDGYWEALGYLNAKGSHSPLHVSASTFAPYTYYQLLCRAAKGHETDLTFVGKLMGNTNYEFNAIGYSWNGYSNSYTGQINAEALLDGLNENLDKTVYVFHRTGEDTYNWETRNYMSKPSAFETNIQPMQAFLLRNSTHEDLPGELSYEEIVFNPLKTQNKAPKQRSLGTKAEMNIIVTDAQGISDNVFLAEGQQFTTDYENGYDAIKYMNPDVNIYAMGEEKMAIVATNNLDNTYLGFSCTKDGEYTIHFDNVQGKNYSLVDMMNNTSTPIQNGLSYRFYAVENMNIDNRFMIIESAQAPTSIVNVVNGTAIKNGIYTIMGQFIGSEKMWNSLPQGVYIVNGQRVIK